MYDRKCDGYLTAADQILIQSQDGSIASYWLTFIANALLTRVYHLAISKFFIKNTFNLKPSH